MTTLQFGNVRTSRPHKNCQPLLSEFSFLSKGLDRNSDAFGKSLFRLLGEV